MACLVLERYSPMTCKCHVRNVTGYLQQFSSLGPKPRLFYEVLDFLTIRNIVFYILFRPRGHVDLSGGHSWLTGGCFFSHTCSSSPSQVICFISLHFKVKSLVPDLREGSACTGAGLHGL